MDENEAWIRFSQTGKISDYLSYSALKNSTDMGEEAGWYAEKHRWTGDQRAESRGS